MRARHAAAASWIAEDAATLAMRDRLEVIAKMISGLMNGLDKRKM